MHLIQADRLFDGISFLPENTVLMLDNDYSFKEYVNKSDVDANMVKQYQGVLMPGFINAHCHLELSHLKDCIEPRKGLPQFAKDIILKRNLSTPEEQEEKMLEADKEMWQNGIVAVGDISNSTSSVAVKKQSRVHYHTFVELIGLAPQRSQTVFNAGLETLNHFIEAGLRAGFAAHAPYSTSNELINQIARHCEINQVPFSIHNQESAEETKFFHGEESGFNALYRFLNLDISWFKAPEKNSLINYGELLPTKRAMLVHNTFTTKADMAFVAHKNNYWCFCPGANLYIENTLPDFLQFKPQRKNLCIGTDSLASNTQLNVLAEASIILKNSKAFLPETILSMLSSNAASALGIESNYGRFIPGKNAGINLIEITESEIRLLKKIA